MKYRLLGKSALRVSELCLGGGTFGTNWGTLGSDKQESQRIFDAFTQAGGNFIDTSNRYQEGQSEAFLGEFIQSDRDRYVMATKFSLVDGMQTGDDPNGCGNHRKNLFRSVEGSLKRLGTDYIDLLWVHIWDYSTPMAEMMRALDDLVRQGKVLHIGASNFPAWWIARANLLAETRGWTPFTATQLEYSMVERSCEPEFLPMAKELDLAFACWSPLAGGLVSGKYNRGQLDPGQPHRLLPHTDPEKQAYWYSATQRNLAIMEKVIKISENIGRSPVQVCLRWLMQKPVVSVPIFSARTLEQAKEDLGCCDFHLSPEDIELLDKASEPAIASVMPAVGPYPYPMLEFGSPALPDFYSRALLFGSTEKQIINDRKAIPYFYNPDN
ncbi:MAG: aldo/keto reductase [Cyanobacteria bacterium P01_D01_bin.1]